MRLGNPDTPMRTGSSNCRSPRPRRRPVPGRPESTPAALARPGSKPRAGNTTSQCRRRRCAPASVSPWPAFSSAETSSQFPLPIRRRSHPPQKSPRTATDAESTRDVSVCQPQNSLREQLPPRMWWGAQAVNGLREQIANSTRSLRDVFSQPRSPPAAARLRGLDRRRLGLCGRGRRLRVRARRRHDGRRARRDPVRLAGVVTPFASTLGDRYSRRLVMVSSDATRAVLVFCGSGADRIGRPEAQRLRARDRHLPLRLAVPLGPGVPDPRSRRHPGRARRVERRVVDDRERRLLRRACAGGPAPRPHQHLGRLRLRRAHVRLVGGARARDPSLRERARGGGGCRPGRRAARAASFTKPPRATARSSALRICGSSSASTARRPSSPAPRSSSTSRSRSACSGSATPVWAS